MACGWISFVKVPMKVKGIKTRSEDFKKLLPFLGICYLCLLIDCDLQPSGFFYWINPASSMKCV